MSVTQAYAYTDTSEWIRSPTTKTALAGLFGGLGGSSASTVAR